MIEQSSVFSSLTCSGLALCSIADRRGSEREDMEHHRALASDLATATTSDSNNNCIVHYRHHYRRRKKRTTKQQQLASSPPSPSPATTRPQSIPMSIAEATTNEQQRDTRRPLSWTKKWTKLFSSCSSERTTPTASPTIITSMEVSPIFVFLVSIEHLHLLFVIDPLSNTNSLLFPSGVDEKFLLFHFSLARLLSEGRDRVPVEE